jgi:hypothetical protein
MPSIDLDRKQLYKKFVVECKSIKQISKEMYACVPTVMKYMYRYGIIRKNVLRDEGDH